MDSHPGLGWSRDDLPKIMNTVPFLFFTLIHAHLAHSGIMIYNRYTGKFICIAPTRRAFLIWLVIHFLLLNILFYQFSENGRRFVKGASWRFLLLIEANALYLYLWYSHLYGWAFCASIIAIAMLISIRGILLENFRTTTVPDELLVCISLSLYDGWMFTIQQITLFATFGLGTSTDIAGFWTLFFMCTIFISMHPLALWFSIIQPAGGIAIA